MNARRALIGQVSDLAKSVIAAMVGVLLALAIFFALSTTPGHDDLNKKLDTIITQNETIICLLLVEPEARVPQNVAECQTGAVGGEDD